MVRTRLLIIIVIGVALVGAALTYKLYLRNNPAIQKVLGKKSVTEQLALHGPTTRLRLKKLFEERELDYPAKGLAFLFFKESRILAVYSQSKKGNWQKLAEYPILGASGKSGPKLREGDSQVPEGFYRIVQLEPNTPFHLALRLNYPNEADRTRGFEDSRKNLGGDIMIHGSDCSIGCLAIGDSAAEDLFVMTADSGIENVEVLIMPYDFRKKTTVVCNPEDPAWVLELYRDLAKSLKRFAP